MKTMRNMAMAGIFLFTFEAMGQGTAMTPLYNYKLPGYSGANLTAGVWGHVSANGREFALTTYRDPGGVEAVEISPTVAPVTRGFVSGPNSVWHEISSYRTTLYSISQQGNAGLQIINLAPLNTGGNISLVTSMPMNGFNTAHTLFVDSTASPARLYCTYGGAQGVVIYSLANPTAPAQIGLIPGEAHDIYARNNRLYISAQRRGIVEIWNVTNAGAPARVGTISLVNQSRTLGEIGASSSTIAHNSWLSENGQHLFTTEETNGTSIKAWSLANEATPTYVSRIQVAGNVIAHNLYVKGNRLYVGHYSAGIRIIDITNPATMAQVAFHDGSSSSATYGGVWGVYPWFPSGLIIYGDDIAGLYITRPPGSTGIRGAGAIARHEFMMSDKNALRFNLPGSGEYFLSVLNAQGREVFGYRGQGQGLQTLSLENGKLSSGNYVMKLRQNDAVRSGQIALGL